MADCRKVAAMQMLNLLFLNAYVAHSNLYLFMALRMVRLSLRYGLCAVSSFGMAMCAMMVGGASNDVALLVGMASCLSKCWTNTK